MNGGGDNEKVVDHYSNFSFFTLIFYKPFDGSGGG